VNRKDKEIHERYHCHRYHDYRDIKASQNEMKASQNGMKVLITRMEEEIKVRPDFLRSLGTIKIVFVNLLLETNFTR
jgi:hypothetical protein